MDKLAFIKLGGSLITEKESGEPILRQNVLERVLREIRDALQEDPELRIILAHGNGSFGHPAALKALEDNESFGQKGSYNQAGAELVREATAQLNQLVMNEMKQLRIEAAYLDPADSFELNKDARDGEFVLIPKTESDLDQWVTALKENRVLLTHGALLDTTRGGFDVCSSEALFQGLCQNLGVESDLRITRALFLGKNDGFHENVGTGSLVSEIHFENRHAHLSDVGAPNGKDVSGGWRTRLQHGFFPGVDVTVSSGEVAGLCKAWLKGESVVGTRLIHS